MLLRVGMLFGSSVGTGEASGVAGPVLTWNDDLQRLFIDLAIASVFVGSVLTVEFYGDAGLASLVSTATNELDGDEIESGLLELAAGLSNGTYYASAYTTGSARGNTEVVTISGTSTAGEAIGLLLILTKAA